MIIGYFLICFFVKLKNYFIIFRWKRSRAGVGRSVVCIAFKLRFCEKSHREVTSTCYGIAFSGHKVTEKVTSLPTIRNLIQTLWAGAKNVGRREMTFLACPSPPGAQQGTQTAREPVNYFCYVTTG